MNQAKQELSIRKVLGATVESLYLYFSIRFLKLVFLGSIVGMPISYIFFNQWLEDYSSRIELGFEFFGLSMLLILVLAILTITHIIFKAIQSDPVKHLRSE